MNRRITAGFVPLVDCAVLVVAREVGFAEQHGLELDLVKEPSWAGLRDHLILGYVDCAHSLAPLPIASALGVGHVRVDCTVPFVLGRGGNAITLARPVFDEMCAAAGTSLRAEPRSTGAALAKVVRRRPAPLTLGMVFPFSTHNFDLRYWLASAGIHPDQDVRLVAIPPPLMVESLRAGHIDGFCVGEPWNSLAVADGLGQIVATKSQLLPRGVEKVLAMRPALAADADTLRALLRALAGAASWADDRGNAAELARLLAAPKYLDVPAALIEDALTGRLALGDGGRLEDPDFLYFARYGGTAPREDEALWLYAQMVRWGQLAASDASRQRAMQVFRPDLYRVHLGVPAASPLPQPFDGHTFDPSDLDTYLAQLPVATPYVAAPRVDSG